MMPVYGFDDHGETRMITPFVELELSFPQDSPLI